MRRFGTSEYQYRPLHDRDRHVLNIVSEIAQYSDHAPASLPGLARDTGYNVSYLEKLAAHLRQHGIVKSIRGVNGGYVLARAPEKISVAEILTAARVTHQRGPRDASRFHQDIDAVFNMTKDIQSVILGRISLADILDDRAAVHPFLRDLLAKFCSGPCESNPSIPGQDN